MMFASASGELNTRSGAELTLQSVRDLEDAALARDVRQRRDLARVGDVFAEDDDARIARHLVLQRAVDGGDHRVGLALGLRGRCRTPADVGSTSGEKTYQSAVSVPACGAASAAVVASRNLAIDVGGDGVDLASRGKSFADQKLAHPRDRIPPRLRLRAPPASCTSRSSSDSECEYGRMTLACTKAGLRSRRTHSTASPSVR